MGSAELILISGMFLAGIAVYFFVSAILTNNTDSEVLSWASGDEPALSKSPVINFSRPLVHQFTLQHAVRIKNKRFREKIENLILRSGLSSELNVDEFIGLKILWGLMFPVLLVILNFALELGFPTFICLALGVVGYYFPNMHANAERKKRIGSVQVDLPFFIDLLALSTEAGLDFVGSIQRIVDKAESSVLADEFSTVLKDIKLGSARADALKAMANRLDMPETTSFIAVLVDADSTGASISKVLKDQSEQMRMERFTRAEKAGARASQTILLPLMMFILPAVFIMVFGPVAIQFIYGN